MNSSLDPLIPRYVLSDVRTMPAACPHVIPCSSAIEHLFLPETSVHHHSFVQGHSSNFGRLSSNITAISYP
jgi:hypothetical protein